MTVPLGLPHARFLDIGVGICCCHSDPTCIPMAGFILTGSTDFQIDGLPAARMLDIVIGFCGHVGFMIGSSDEMFIDGRGSCRFLDIFVGCFSGIIVSGSLTTFVGI